VFYECLTGRVAFSSITVETMISRILSEAPDWSVIPADLGERHRELLRRCLEKEPRKRLRDIGEARVILEDNASGVVGEVPAKAPLRPFRRVFPWVVGALLLTLGVYWTGS